MLPMAHYRAAGDAVLLSAEGKIRAGDFFARARALAAALPDRRHVINICESRHAFMLAFAAALLRRQTTLLPPGQGRADRELMRESRPDCYVICDKPMAGEAAFDLSSFLVAGPAAGNEETSLAMPMVEEDAEAAVLFTSGSTGRPSAHVKTWGRLWQGAAALAQALQWDGGARAVVGSVPPQHMFGLETTVILPWYTGIPVHGLKPLLPADLECAMADCGRPVWWMTTPTHLHAPLRSTVNFSPLAGVVASTMNLPVDLAAAGEAAWGVAITEVYGSTETGALATRRTALDQWWTPLAGVSVTTSSDMDANGDDESAAGGGNESAAWAAGPHVGEKVRLGDRLDVADDGRFRWIGRAGDLVKIGGKRGSLSALNTVLTGIAGVDDAVYFFPDEAGGDASHPTHRLVAFYVSASLAPDAVLTALRGKIDPVFLPRPLFRVAALPRNANGKLPRAALAALLAECRADAGGGIADARVVPADHPAIPGHFPGDPIVPGVMVLQLVTEDIARQLPGVGLGTLLTARFHRPLRPGERCVVTLSRREDRLHFEARTADDAAPFASGQWQVARDEAP